MLPFFISYSGKKMFEQIDRIKEEFETDSSTIKNINELEDLRIKYLGRKGKISAAFQLLAEVP
ncbi:hypothetical protein MUO66_00680, partial [Candidatus Bathyarchaeota archaeon]|nr:hypothetical protein [Candidatus Bathyarchaeota archaeon]